MPTQEVTAKSRKEALRQARLLHSLHGYAVPESTRVTKKIFEVTYHWAKSGKAFPRRRKK